MVTASWQPLPLPQPGLRRPPHSQPLPSHPLRSAQPAGRAGGPSPGRAPAVTALGNGRSRGGSAPGAERGSAGSGDAREQRAALPCPEPSPVSERRGCPGSVPPRCMAIEWCLHRGVLSAVVHPVFPQPPPRPPVTPAPRGRDCRRGRAAGRAGRAGQGAQPGAGGAPARSPRSRRSARAGTGADRTYFSRGPLAWLGAPLPWLGAPGTVTALPGESLRHPSHSACSQVPQPCTGVRHGSGSP